MPWNTPSLSDVRKMARDNVTAAVSGASMVGNSAMRVMTDSQAALCYLCLLYLDWLSKQLLPDTAETEWLDRHGKIWLINSDGSVGRKAPALAQGTVTFTGTVDGTPVPAGTVLSNAANVAAGITYQTLATVLISTATPVPVAVQALLGGTAGNMNPGDTLGLTAAIANVDSTATVVTLTGGTDQETDDELRARVLERIQNVPMGGDKEDYIKWTLEVSGVTRAWCYPQEMGIGTNTVRFMMDDLRSDNYGIPTADDVNTVQAFVDTVRPVTVKDMFVEAPIAQPIDFNITNLNPDSTAIRSAIQTSILNMLALQAIPGQTIYRVWKSDAILGPQTGVTSFDLSGDDDVMPDNGHIAVLGNITYG